MSVLEKLQLNYDGLSKNLCFLEKGPLSQSQDLNLNGFNKKTYQDIPIKNSTCVKKLSDKWASKSQYKLEQIGKGGFGKIYRITNTDNNKTMVIKETKSTHITKDHYLIQKNIDDIKFGLNFTKKYPGEDINITNYEACCVEVDARSSRIEYTFYILMEEYKFGDLRKMLKSRDGLKYRTDTKWKFRIITKILEAMQKTRSHNIMHRDLKPENVLMKTPYDPYIADFGLISFASNTHTRVGTPLYMAPEINDYTYDNNIDIYSLGIMIFEILNSSFNLNKTYYDDIMLFCGKINAPLYYKQKSYYVNSTNKYPIGLFEDLEQKLYCKEYHKVVMMMLHSKPRNRPSLKDIIGHFISAQSKYVDSIDNVGKPLLTIIRD